ncbi:MAG: tRNA pseudouridine(54/55) synthase Pus10 [Nitrososphaeria archaeon]
MWTRAHQTLSWNPEKDINRRIDEKPKVMDIGTVRTSSDDAIARTEARESANMPGVLKTAAELLGQRYICDRCLGRAFAKLLHGLTNEQRGRTLRETIALMLDAGSDLHVHPNNFKAYEFRNLRFDYEADKPCFFCMDIFKELVPALQTEALQKLRDYEFETFLVGTKLSRELKERDLMLVQSLPEYGESLRDEVNRLVGKKVEEVFHKPVRFDEPELFLLIDLQDKRTQVKSKSIYVYGGYRKLRRGIPQTTWHCRICGGKGCRRCNWTGKLYRTSVQQIIERPLLRLTKGDKSSFHGSGREDIDVRCLDYRPFVIEIVNPRKRKIDLTKVEKEINRLKAVKVMELKLASKTEITSVKESRNDKVYHAIVTFNRKVRDSDIVKLSLLRGAIVKQKTPTRVLHRRADISRERRIEDLKFRRLSDKKVDLIIECEAGTYVKELISGDNSRTKPSVAELLDNSVRRIVLDVIRIKEQ